MKLGAAVLRWLAAIFIPTGPKKGQLWAASGQLAFRAPASPVANLIGVRARSGTL